MKTVSDLLDEANGKLSKASKGLSTASIFLGVFVASVKTASNAAKELSNAMSEVSNRYITNESIFFNEDIRDIMAKFGIDSSTAQAMQAAMDALNIDIEDFAKLPEGTRKAFDDLMKHYQDGINSLDTNKLDRFNEVVQQYQLRKVKFEMDLQLIYMKLLTQSDALPNLLETIGNALDSITTILDSDAFQVGFEILSGLINGILEFATAPLNLIGKLFGEGNSSNVVNNNNTANTNTFNINGNYGTSSKQLAMDIAMQLQNVTTP